jgi:hypothetical protein
MGFGDTPIAFRETPMSFGERGLTSGDASMNLGATPKPHARTGMSLREPAKAFRLLPALIHP